MTGAYSWCLQAPLISLLTPLSPDFCINQWTNTWDTPLAVQPVLVTRLRHRASEARHALAILVACGQKFMTVETEKGYLWACSRGKYGDWAWHRRAPAAGEREINLFMRIKPLTEDYLNAWAFVRLAAGVCGSARGVWCGNSCLDSGWTTCDPVDDGRHNDTQLALIKSWNGHD